jgi:hypothetical protein
MVSKTTVTNYAASFGRLAALFQGIVCIALALAMIVTGSITLGSSNTRGSAVFAKVVGVECDKHGKACAIAVRLPCGTQKTFETSNAYKFSEGDDISVLVDAHGTVSENLPYRAIGWTMIAAALGMVLISVWAISVIAKSKDLSAVFGGLTAFGFIFG